MNLLTFTALKNGATITDSGTVRLGHYDSDNYSSVLTIDSTKLVERIVSEQISSYTATLGLFIDRHTGGARQTIYFYIGNTNIYSTRLDDLSFISIDLTNRIEAEVTRYQNLLYVQPITITISLSITGLCGSEVSMDVDSYVDIYSLNNSDTFMRPHLGIKKSLDLNIRKNNVFPVESPYIGSTMVDSLNSRIRHSFDLFTVEANSLSFNLSLIYDSYFKENQNLRPQRFDFGPGVNLNIDEFITKSSNYSGDFGDKSICLYDSLNNKIEFKQKWYYYDSNNHIIYFNPSTYQTRISGNMPQVKIGNVWKDAYYRVSTQDDSMIYRGKDFNFNYYEMNKYDQNYDVIIDSAENLYYFDNNGSIIRIVDINNNKIEISSSSIISYINSDGQAVGAERVDVDIYGKCNHLSLYAFNGNQSISINTCIFDYNENDELCEIIRYLENNENLTLTISYEDEGYLSSISSSIPYVLSLGYYNNKINNINLSSTIDTIYSTITTQSSKTLFEHSIYSFGLLKTQLITPRVSIIMITIRF